MAVLDVIREANEGRRLLLVVVLEEILRVGDELIRDLLGLLEADEGRIGGLADRLVLARRLAELLRGLRAVQDVVHNLKR